MTSECIFSEIKQVLNGRPGQAMVLGVCRTLAVRINAKVWLVRLAAIVLGVFWTLPILVAYVLAGCILPETEDRTRSFFAGLGIMARETAEKILASLGRVFASAAETGSRRRSY